MLFHDVDGEENGGEFESVTLGVDQMEKSQIKKAEAGIRELMN